MRVATATRDVEAIGLGESTTATVAMGAKFVKIFSNQIYSNKPLAIIGELIANAWDSHRAAGREHVPIEVHLPTIFNKQLRVTDYGVGMSDDFVMNQLNQILFSTKDQDDTFAGGLGLGHWTPLAYTDSFVIRCRQDGEMRTYVKFKNSVGVPETSRVSVEETDLPDGVDIILDIEEKDMGAFSNAARFVIPWVKTPSVDVRGTEVPDIEWHMNNEEFGTINAEFPWGYNQSAYVLVGPRAYTLDLQQDGLSEWRYLNNINGTLVVHADIGEVEITPSRESVSYSKTTVENLVKKLRHVGARLFDTLEERLKEKETFPEAFEFWAQNINVWLLRNQDQDRVQRGEWKGIPFIKSSTEALTCWVFRGDQKISWANFERYEHPLAWQYLRSKNGGEPQLLIRDVKQWKLALKSVIKDMPPDQTLVMVDSVATADVFYDYYKLDPSPLYMSDVLATAKAKAKKVATPTSAPAAFYLWTTDGWSELDKNVEQWLKQPDTYWVLLKNRKMQTQTGEEKHDCYMHLLNEFHEKGHYIIGIPTSHQRITRRLTIPHVDEYLKAKLLRLEDKNFHHALLRFQATHISNLDDYSRALKKQRYLSKSLRTLFARLHYNEVWMAGIKFNSSDVQEYYSHMTQVLGDIWGAPPLPKHQLTRDIEQLQADFPAARFMIEHGHAWYDYWKERFHNDLRPIAIYLAQQEQFHECMSID